MRGKASHLGPGLPRLQQAETVGGQKDGQDALCRQTRKTYSDSIGRKQSYKGLEHVDEKALLFFLAATRISNNRSSVQLQQYTQFFHLPLV